MGGTCVGALHVVTHGSGSLLAHELLAQWVENRTARSLLDAAASLRCLGALSAAIGCSLVIGVCVMFPGGASDA